MTPDLDKLERWAAHLETPEVAEHFDMALWANSAFLDSPKACNTTAYALGHATTIFPELIVEHTGDDWIDVVLHDHDVAYRNFEAAARFFGISRFEADLICSHEEYEVGCDDDGFAVSGEVTPAMVAARICELIAAYKSEAISI